MTFFNGFSSPEKSIQLERKHVFSHFHKYPDSADFSLRWQTLRFVKPEVEARFKRQYFESNLQLGRACHLIAIALYGSIGLWDGLIIDRTRLAAWIIAIAIVSLVFLSGLLFSYRSPELYSRFWEPLYAFYVLTTGLGITAVASTTASGLPLYNFVGIIYCLFFCYTFIRLTFVWAASAGNTIIALYTTGIAMFSMLDWRTISTHLIYMAGVNILGMTINYALELLARRDFMLGERLKAAEQKATALNVGLEQKVAERTRALKKSLASLQQAEAIAGLGYFEYECASGTGYWSQGLYRLLGYPPAKTNLPDLNTFLNWIGLPRSPFTDHRRGAQKNGVSFDREIAITRENGETLDVHVFVDIVVDKDGKPQITKGVVMDIRERARAREALQNTEAQLIQAQKMESIGRLAGGVAHDYNNVSSIIIGYSELALEEMDKGNPLYTSFQEILNAARRSTAITRQLLAFARKQTVSPTILDLNRTLEGMLKMLGRLIGEDISLSWLPGPDLWPVLVDASQVDQVLANLCINARDAISGTGTITIETGNCSLDESYCRHYSYVNPGDYVMLAVSDTGCGIMPEHLDSIFEPFFTTKGIGQGTGLGLSTVYGIMKQNNGFINAYSELGRGTTFKVYFPRLKGRVEAAEVPAITVVPKGNSERILLVEDDRSILEIATRLLVTQGYRVITASSPTEALQQHQKQAGKIDLLITDVIMPEMNGRELANLLLVRNKTLKVLFMSGYSANVIAHHGVLDRGVHFLQKPFNRKTLAEKVWEILQHDEGVS